MTARVRTLRPGQVARLFGVKTEAVRRWSLAGHLHPTTTKGGHRRYPEAEVRALLAAGVPDVRCTAGVRRVPTFVPDLSEEL